MNLSIKIVCISIVLAADNFINVTCQYSNSNSIFDRFVSSIRDVYKIAERNIYKVFKRVGQKIGIFEGCEDFWIPGNMRGLENDLLENVFGQPIAIEIIVKAIKYHLTDDHPTRALTLSLHGDPGTGKNFVSKKILENMFRKGKDTEYVHFFRGSIDFPSKYETYKYKEKIMNVIKDKIYECHRSIFVFDEVEKMPPGILDVLSVLIRQGKMGDFDYRRAIFILLSNIGQRVLFQETLQSYIDGQQRNDMDKNRLSQLLEKEAYMAKGGLEHSMLIKDRTISYYIPFLPLEQSHIVQCMKKEVQQQNQIMSHELQEQVLQELTFKPDGNPIFAYGGCKIVPEKVQFFITRQQRRNQRRYLEL